MSLKKTLLTGIAVLSVALHTPAAAQSYVLRGGDKLASTFTGLSVLVPAGAHAEPSSRHVTKLYDEPGGLVSEHVMLWRKLARSGDEVEIRAMCPSACTLILAYVPRERICFGDDAKLLFHVVRNGYDRSFDPEATAWMFNKYPADIREWLRERGGLEAGDTIAYADQLWEMGYRRCGPDNFTLGVADPWTGVPYNAGAYMREEPVPMTVKEIPR